jgi:hypothetical protein
MMTDFWLMKGATGGKGFQLHDPLELSPETIQCNIIGDYLEPGYFDKKLDLNWSRLELITNARGEAEIIMWDGGFDYHFQITRLELKAFGFACINAALTEMSDLETRTEKHRRGEDIDD